MAKKFTKTAVPAPKSRSVTPIPNTKQTIKGYPSKLVIFKVPASPYWWVRYHDDKPIKRSTKTENKQEAIAYAKEFYEQILIDKHSDTKKIRKTSFRACAEDLIAEEERRAKRDEIAKTTFHNQKNLIRRYIVGYLGRYEVSDIDYAVLDKFKTYLYDKDLAGPSIKQHFVATHKILAYAERSKLIKAIPQFPKIKNDDNPRDPFNLKEYQKLCTTARKLVGTQSEIKQRIKTGDTETIKKLRNINITLEMRLLISFMIYTFVRPTDLKTIKHKHIEIKKGDEGDYLFMPIPATKKHGKPITSMPRAAILYKKLRAYRFTEIGDTEKDISDEYLFLPQFENRDYAYKTLIRQFNVILEAADLKAGNNGGERSLYSLRHTSIMFRLQYGGDVSPLILANNARTSVEMLERFYLSRLESSKVTADIHAKKVNKRRRKEASVFVTFPNDRNINLSKLIDEEQKKLPDKIGKQKITLG